MKKTLGTGLAFLFSLLFGLAFANHSAFAAAAGSVFSNPNTSNDIKSLDYMPQLGHFSIRPETTLSISDQAGSNTQSYNSMTVGVFAGLFARGLRFGITEGLEFSRISDNYSSKTGVTTPGFSSGLSDPTFSVEYRYLQDVNNGLSSDIELQVTPNLLTDYLPKTDQHGSYAVGKSVFTLTLPVWWTYASNQFEIQPTFSYYTTGTSVAPVGEGSGRLGSYKKLSVTLADRFHFSPSFFAAVSGVINFATTMTYTDTDPSSTVSNSTATPLYFQPMLDIGYKPNNTFLIRFIYTYQTYTTTTTSQTGSVTTALNIESTLGVQSTFNF